MNKEFIIFDFDNTLVDSLGYWKITTDKLMFEKYGLKPNPQMPQLRRGKGNNEIADDFIKLTGLKISHKEVVDGWFDFMSKFYLTKVKMLKGAKEFLFKLKAEGKKLILVSATEKKLLKLALKHFEIDVFDEIFTETSLDCPKRNENFYEIVLSKLKTTANNVFLFEDSFSSIKSAVHSKIETVAFLHEFNKHHKKELKQMCKLVLKNYKSKKLLSLW